MRAPPLSLRPITGAPTFIAMSITLQIFWAWRSDSEPPKTKTCRPMTVTDPATTRPEEDTSELQARLHDLRPLLHDKNQVSVEKRNEKDLRQSEDRDES